MYIYVGIKQHHAFRPISVDEIDDFLFAVLCC